MSSFQWRGGCELRHERTKGGNLKKKMRAEIKIVIIWDPPQKRGGEGEKTFHWGAENILGLEKRNDNLNSKRGLKWGSKKVTNAGRPLLKS